jgi:uncharacterized protein (DUF3820 family)
MSKQMELTLKFKNGSTVDIVDTPSKDDLIGIPGREMPLEDGSPMPFGNFRGDPMESVPKAYLYYFFTERSKWLASAYPNVFNYCEEALEDYDPDNDPDEFEEYYDREY